MGAKSTTFSRNRSGLSRWPAQCLSAERGTSGLRLTKSRCKIWQHAEDIPPGHPVFRIALGHLQGKTEGAHGQHASELLAHLPKRAFDDAKLAKLEAKWWAEFEARPLSSFPEISWEAWNRLTNAGLKTCGDLLAHTSKTLRKLPGVGQATVMAVNRAYSTSYLPRRTA